MWPLFYLIPFVNAYLIKYMSVQIQHYILGAYVTTVTGKVTALVCEFYKADMFAIAAETLIYPLHN